MPKSASKRKANEITDHKLTTKEKRKIEKAKAAAWAANKYGPKKAAAVREPIYVKDDDDDSNDDVVVEPTRKKKKTETVATGKVPGKMSKKELELEKAKQNAQRCGNRDKAQLDQKKATKTGNTGIVTSIQPGPKTPPAAKMMPPSPQSLPVPPEFVPSVPDGQTVQRPTNASSRRHASNLSMVTRNQDLLVDHNDNRQQKKTNLQEQLRLQQQSRLKGEQQQKLDHLSNLLTSKRSGVNAYDAGASFSAFPKVPVEKKLPVIRKTSPVAYTNGEDDSDGDNDMPPPLPPGLQTQISQQVLTNARDDRYEKDGYDPLIEGALLNGDDEEEESPDVEINAGSTDAVVHDRFNNVRMNWFRWIAIIVALSSFWVFMTLPEPFFNEVMETSNTGVDDQQCVFDPEAGNEGVCSVNIRKGIPCPRGGVCNGGLLIECPNTFQEMSEEKDQCTLSEKYLPMKIIITDELVNRASRNCNMFTAPVEYDSLKSEHSESMVELSLALIDALECEGYRTLEDEEGRLYLDLPEGFILHLPLYCNLGNFSHSLFGTIGNLLWNVITVFLTNVWGLLKFFPKFSLVAFFVLGCFGVNRRRRAKREQRERDIELLREMAYKYLKGNPNTAHVILHVRDAITMELHPNSRKERQILNTNIWPRIVTHLKDDTRVRKKNRIIDGNTRETQQWAAAE